MMRRSIGIFVVSSLVLTSCGTVRDSRLNPFNWFGSAERVETSETEEINPLIPQKRESIFERDAEAYGGTPVLAIKDVIVERIAGGAIIRVVGIARTQGAFETRLEPENDEETPVDGVLTYRLLAIQPFGHRTGPERSREVNIALYRTDQELEGVRTIRVVGQGNALQVRRR